MASTAFVPIGITQALFGPSNPTTYGRAVYGVDVGVEPAVAVQGSYHRAGHDVLLVGRPIAQPAVPRAQVGQLRPIEIHIEPAVRMHTPGDVGQREILPCDV